MAIRRSSYFVYKLSRAFSSSAQTCAKESYRFVVVGGGAGGLSVASTLCRRFGKGATAVIEPSEVMLSLVNRRALLESDAYYRLDFTLL